MPLEDWGQQERMVLFSCEFLLLPEKSKNIYEHFFCVWKAMVGCNLSSVFIKVISLWSYLDLGTGRSSSCPGL